MSKGFSIVFMGTPEFSVPTLDLLQKSHHEVALVVTQPDRPKGRGRSALPPPVKSAALEKGLTVTQPDSVRGDTFAGLIKEAAPDLFAVIAFGHILPAELLAMPRLGAINVHASLLPKYRGAAPIQWAIINGESHTGITTIQMDTGMDTGNVLLSSEIPIEADDTSDTLRDRLADLGARLMLETLDRLAAGRIRPVPQQHALATYAPMLKKGDGRIDWHLPAEKIERFVRGVTPWPGAFTFHGDRRLKIFSSRPIGADTEGSPGTVLRGFPDELRIATGRRALSILEIQGASGRRLPIGEFLRGYPLPPGSVLE